MNYNNNNNNEFVSKSRVRTGPQSHQKSLNFDWPFLSTQKSLNFMKGPQKSLIFIVTMNMSNQCYQNEYWACCYTVCMYGLKTDAQI